MPRKSSITAGVKSGTESACCASSSMLMTNVSELWPDPASETLGISCFLPLSVSGIFFAGTEFLVVCLATGRTSFFDGRVFLNLGFSRTSPTSTDDGPAQKTTTATTATINPITAILFLLQRKDHRFGFADALRFLPISGLIIQSPFLLQDVLTRSKLIPAYTII